MSSELGASDAVVSRQVPVTASGRHTYVFFRAKTSVSGVLTVDGWYGLIRETFRACPESCSKGVGGNPLAVVSLMTSPTSGARSTSPHREEGWTCPVAQHGLDEG